MDKYNIIDVLILLYDGSGAGGLVFFLRVGGDWGMPRLCLGYA